MPDTKVHSWDSEDRCACCPQHTRTPFLKVQRVYPRPPVGRGRGTGGEVSGWVLHCGTCSNSQCTAAHVQTHSSALWRVCEWIGERFGLTHTAWNRSSCSSYTQTHSVVLKQFRAHTHTHTHTHTPHSAAQNQLLSLTHKQLTHARAHKHTPHSHHTHTSHTPHTPHVHSVVLKQFTRARSLSPPTHTTHTHTAWR